MAREFTSQEAKQVLNYHNSISDKLNLILKSKQDLLNKVRNAADVFAAGEVIKVLSGIPVDELNRDKNGIRVKTLYDNGIRTMADVQKSTVYNLASINGISEDSALTIKRICKTFFEQTQKEVKIKLSSDEKNKYSNELVRSIAVYLKCSELFKLCDDISEKHRAVLSQYSVTLRPALNGIAWLFASKAKKEKATTAYNTLSELKSDELITAANSCIHDYSRLTAMDAAEAWSYFAADNIRFFNLLEETNPGLLGTDDVLYGLPEELAKQIQEECIFPDGLLCTLRRYQEWGVKFILHQEKVLLGDEMGLGKTIQAIAVMVSLKNVGATHFIVVCPASVLSNWCREITKHSLLSVTRMHGNCRTSAYNAWKKSGGVGVTTYETLSAFPLDDIKPSLLIVDEAHYIKNPNARRTVNVKKIAAQSERLLFMTGTALENNVGEMINLIGMLQPQIANSVSPIAFMASAPQFRLKVAPVYYRRKREDVLTELPEKSEVKEWCELLPEEERVYEDAILDKRYADARRVSWNIRNLSKSSKATRLMEIVEEAESDGRKVLVFSFFLDTIHSIVGFLGDRCLNPISGAVTPQRRQDIIDEFEKAPAGTVLVSQIQSGGTGLNIQAASIVVICEPQFKPSIENQAISRAYRMGQSRNVLVYRLLCENTIDEHLTQLLENKQQIFDAFADKSVAAEKQEGIDNSAFNDIINDEIARIKQKRGIRDNTVESSTDYVNENTTDVESQDSSAVLNAEKEPIQANRKIDGSVPETRKNFDYYERLMKKSYAEIVDFLLLHHGSAKYDYFTNESCKSKNRNVTRTSEGLFCHHIDEDKAILLADSENAVKNPFSYQKADRLVYCNYLEHLLLHIKIAEEPRSSFSNQNEEQGIGGAIIIANLLNDVFMGVRFTLEWQTCVADAVKADYDSYVMYIRYLLRLANGNNDAIKFFIIQKIAFSPATGKVFEKLIHDISDSQ